MLSAFYEAKAFGVRGGMPEQQARDARYSQPVPIELDGLSTFALAARKNPSTFIIPGLRGEEAVVSVRASTVSEGFARDPGAINLSHNLVGLRL
jgi:hypothetical protein